MKHVTVFGAIIMDNELPSIDDQALINNVAYCEDNKLEELLLPDSMHVKAVTDDGFKMPVSVEGLLSCIAQGKLVLDNVGDFERMIEDFMHPDLAEAYIDRLQDCISKQ